MPDPGEPESAGESYVLRRPLHEVGDLLRLAQLAETLFGRSATLEAVSGSRLVVGSLATGEPLAVVEFEVNEWPGSRWVIRPVEGGDGSGGASR